MTVRLNLQPSIAAIGPGGVNITTALTALGSNTGVMWSNTGREILIVSVGTSATVVTNNIGITVLGQGVTAPTVSLSASTIYALGAYASAYDQPSSGTNEVYVDFSVQTNVSVALLQLPGVS